MSNGAGPGDGNGTGQNQQAGQEGAGTPGEGLSGGADSQQGGDQGGAAGAQGDGEGAGAGEAGTPGEGLSGGKGKPAAGQDGSGDGDGTGKDGEGAGEQGDGDSGSDLLGVPDGGYGEFSLPEGATVDEGMMELARDAFKEMGLSQVGGQKVVDLYAKVAEYEDAKFEEYRVSKIKEDRDTWIKDPVFGGDNIEQSQIWIKKAVDVLLKDDPYNTLARYVTSGQEFDPGLMRAFAIAGKLFSDDTFDGGGDKTHQRTDKNAPRHKRMYPELP